MPVPVLLENRVELTKEFLGGDAINASEKIYDVDNRLLSEEKFNFDPVTNKFVTQEMLVYNYDDAGMLVELRTKKPMIESIKKYIYQFDAGANGNWIKKIVTPDNSYITRKIQYYAPVVIDGKK